MHHGSSVISLLWDKKDSFMMVFKTRHLELLLASQIMANTINTRTQKL